MSNVQCRSARTVCCLRWGSLRPVGAFAAANLPSQCHEFPSPEKICRAHILTPWSSKGSQLRSFPQIAQPLGLQCWISLLLRLSLRTLGRNTTLPLFESAWNHGANENKARYWQIRRMLKLLQLLWYSQTSWNRSSWQPTCHLPPCSWKAPRQGCNPDPKPERLNSIEILRAPQRCLGMFGFGSGLFDLIQSYSLFVPPTQMEYDRVSIILVCLRISLGCLVSVSRALLWRRWSCFSACSSFPWQVPQETCVSLLICSGNCFKSPQVRERFGQDIGEQVLRKKAASRSSPVHLYQVGILSSVHNWSMKIPRLIYTSLSS